VSCIVTRGCAASHSFTAWDMCAVRLSPRKWTALPRGAERVTVSRMSTNSSLVWRAATFPCTWPVPTFRFVVLKRIPSFVNISKRCRVKVSSSPSSRLRAADALCDSSSVTSCRRACRASP